MAKKNLFVLVFIFLSVSICKAQSVDSLDYYAGKLNWESFGVIPNYATTTYRFDVNALKIIAILTADKHKRYKFLGFINQQEKTVAVHAIFTQLYYPKKLQPELKSIFKIDKNGKILYDQVEGYQLTLNGVLWKLMFSKDTSQYSYISPQIKTLQLYWGKTIRQSKK